MCIRNETDENEGFRVEIRDGRIWIDRWLAASWVPALSLPLLLGVKLAKILMAQRHTIDGDAQDAMDGG